MYTRILLPLSLLLVGIGLPPGPARADRQAPVIDLTAGRLVPDSASRGSAFTLLSVGETKKDTGKGTQATPGSGFWETTSDYAYRGAIFSPDDYVLAVQKTYNRYLTSRVFLNAGVGADLAAFAGAKHVVGMARSAGAGWRVVQGEQMTIEARLRWSSFEAPGEQLTGLAPMIRLRWQPGR